MPEAHARHHSTTEQAVGLTPELIERWRRFKAEHRQEDRDALILHYWPLVQRVAGVIKQSLPRGIDADDLAGWGVFGLIEAIENYEPDRGIAFSSFARFRIRGAIMDELRRLDWLPRSVRATQKRESHAPLADPDDSRADDGNLKFPGAGAVPSMVALDDAFMTGAGTMTFAREGVSRLEVLEARDQLLRGLSRSERLILYYCEEMTMKDVGITLGISECRVSQIRSQIIARLQSSDRKAA